MHTPSLESEPAPRHALAVWVRQSLRGQHVLFDEATVKEALQRPPRTARGEAAAAWDARVAEALDRISRLPTLAEQRRWVASLPEPWRRRVCYHYFRLVGRWASELAPHEVH